MNHLGLFLGIGLSLYLVIGAAVARPIYNMLNNMEVLKSKPGDEVFKGEKLDEHSLRGLLVLAWPMILPLLVLMLFGMMIQGFLWILGHITF